MTPITEVEGRRLALSNLEKVLYPATGFTKGEVLHYYATTAEVLLPHLRDRPVSFLRYPDGPDGQVFFTKNVPPGTPDWVTTAEVPRSEGPARMVLVQDLASLMWAANLVTEFHTPQWVIGRPGRSPTGWSSTSTRGRPRPSWSAARSRCGCGSGSRRTGSRRTPRPPGRRGCICWRRVRPAPSEQVSEYAKELAVEAEQAMPRLVVHRMTRSLRPGKVFVDWSQNAARKTTATPYTLRARREPTVSAPVTWERGRGVRGARPNSPSWQPDIAPRLQDYGDLLAPLLDPDGAGSLP